MTGKFFYGRMPAQVKYEYIRAISYSGVVMPEINEIQEAWIEEQFKCQKPERQVSMLDIEKKLYGILEKTKSDGVYQIQHAKNIFGHQKSQDYINLEDPNCFGARLAALLYTSVKVLAGSVRECADEQIQTEVVAIIVDLKNAWDNPNSKLAGLTFDKKNGILVKIKHLLETVSTKEPQILATDKLVVSSYLLLKGIHFEGSENQYARMIYNTGVFSKSYNQIVVDFLSEIEAIYAKLPKNSPQELSHSLKEAVKVEKEKEKEKEEEEDELEFEQQLENPRKSEFEQQIETLTKNHEEISCWLGQIHEQKHFSEKIQAVFLHFEDEEALKGWLTQAGFSAEELESCVATYHSFKNSGYIINHLWRGIKLDESNYNRMFKKIEEEQQTLYKNIGNKQKELQVLLKLQDKAAQAEEKRVANKISMKAEEAFKVLEINQKVMEIISQFFTSLEQRNGTKPYLCRPNYNNCIAELQEKYVEYNGAYASNPSIGNAEHYICELREIIHKHRGRANAFSIGKLNTVLKLFEEAASKFVVEQEKKPELSRGRGSFWFFAPVESSLSQDQSSSSSCSSGCLIVK